MYKWKITWYNGRDKRETEIEAYTHLEAVKKAGVIWPNVLDVIKMGTV